MDLCDHPESKENKVIYDKNIKIIHKVLSKLSTYIKATVNEITHENFHTLLTVTMREINKNSLYGHEKKEICTHIILLLLEMHGMPHITAFYTAHVIESAIEEIYSYGFHKFKRVKKCIIT